jgi:hypothetical protein
MVIWNQLLGDFKMSDSIPPCWDIIEYPRAVASLVENFYCSNHNLLLVVICLQQLHSQVGLSCKFF